MNMTLNQLVNGLGSITLLELMLVIATFLGLGLLVYAQFQRDKFDLRFLILDDANKKPSIHKLGQAISLLVSTWGFVYAMVHDRFNVEYLVIYMSIWTGSVALNRLMDVKTEAVMNKVPTAMTTTTTKITGAVNDTQT